MPSCHRANVPSFRLDKYTSPTQRRPDSQPQSIKKKMADKMGDEQPQNLSKSLLNFDKKWGGGGDEGIRTLERVTPLLP